MAVLACSVEFYNTAGVPLSRAGPDKVNPPQRTDPAGGSLQVVGPFRNSSGETRLLGDFGTCALPGKLAQNGGRSHPYAYFARSAGRNRSGLGRRHRHSDFAGRACDLEWLSAAAMGHRRLSGALV